MRGTLLNTATVGVGAALGVAAGHNIPETYKAVALHGLGLVTLGFAVKMFLESRNFLIVGVSVALGGVLGLALGIHAGIENIAHWSQTQLGGEGKFATGIVTSFVLFCIGPMTLLGCLQDGLERKIDILSLKSTMDGIGAFFLAAATGAGLFVTAALLLVFQGALTLAAKPLKPLVDHPSALAEASGTGGALLAGTGLGLLDITDLHTANYLPAIFIAPALALAAERFARRKKSKELTDAPA